MTYKGLQHRYRDEMVPTLKKELGLSNVMEVPKLEKITLNMGVGEALQDKKQLEEAAKELSLIASQKVVTRAARKSVASFKIRVGFPIGAKVTLRGEKMYNFLDRLLTVALPRSRDFRGLRHRSFDKQGNFSLGIQEHIIFPEISLEKASKIRGLDICITTSAKNKEQGLALMKALGAPFA